MNVLSADRLFKSYGRRSVVRGIDIHVTGGEIIGLLGRNGAGKTTTFQMIAGLIKPDSGQLRLNERNISHLPAARRAEEGIIYLPQENSVFLKESVSGNLQMIFELQKISRSERKEKTSSLLKELGLEPLSRQGAYSLSGGERRRLEICRALILSPKFLLLDEPFTGVDPLTIIDLQKILLHLKETGIGIIISDHNVRDTLKITNRAYIIEEGKILITGTPAEIAENPSARKNFLGMNFKLGQEVVR